MRSKEQAHVLAYQDYLGEQWLLGHITQTEYERLSGRRVMRRRA